MYTLPTKATPKINLEVPRDTPHLLSHYLVSYRAEAPLFAGLMLPLKVQHKVGHGKRPVFGGQGPRTWPIDPELC